MKKRNGFTLAEVLITLTIIGVIAALTIPNLIQSYKKHQVEVGIKEAYSILSNAITMAKAEHGSIDEILPVENKDYNSGGTQVTHTIANQFVTNYIVPYLKIAKDCGMVQYSQGGSKECMYQIYNNQDTIKNVEKTGTISRWYMRNILLENGMVLGINATTAAPAVTFWVDINGAKGENAIGHDVFTFSIFRTDIKSYGCYGSGVLLGGHNGYGECNTWIKNPNCTGNGAYCTTMIMKNGWKIPDDYPVKKW